MHVVVVPKRAFAPHGRTWGVALQLYTLRCAAQPRDRRLRRPARGVPAARRARRVVRRASTRCTRRSATIPKREPVCGVFAPLAELALHRGRRRAGVRFAAPMRARARDAALRRVDRGRARAALRRLHAASPRARTTILRACFAALQRRASAARAFDAWCAAQGEPLHALRRLRRARRALRARPRRVAGDVSHARSRPTSRCSPPPRTRRCATRCTCSGSPPNSSRRSPPTRRATACSCIATWRSASTRTRPTCGPTATRTCASVSVGAPPDVLNTLGPGLGSAAARSARAARATATPSCWRCCSANCRHAGALRIDHAFSLARLVLDSARRRARAAARTSTYPLDDLRRHRRAGERARALRGHRRGSRHRARRLSRAHGSRPASCRTASCSSSARADGAFIPPEGYPRARARRVGDARSADDPGLAARRGHRPARAARPARDAGRGRSAPRANATARCCSTR